MKISENISGEILPLTGLRFFAALYVFIFHIHLRWPVAPSDSFFSNIVGQGAVGMSLFFILSGFVLAHRYGARPSDFRSYLLNRFSRIYPVYVVAALLTLPWIGVSPTGDTIFELARNISQIFALIFVDIFVLQAWFPQLFSYWNNGGSWSISVEVFCYILLPFILTHLIKQNNRSIKVTACIAYLLAVLPGLTLVLFYGNYGPSFYSLPVYRLPEFVLGICTSLAVRRLAVSPTVTSTIQLASMGLLIIYLGVLGPKLPMWVPHNWIVLPVIVLTIFSTAQSFGVLSKVLSHPLVVWCGRISYSFYSFQLLVLLLLKSYHADIVQHWPLLADNRILLITSFTVLMLLSAAGYHLIEEPARLWLQRKSRPGKAVAEAGPAAALPIGL